MGETEILSDLFQTVEVNNWWKHLLGQPAILEGFDPYIAMETLPRTEVKAAEAVQRKFENYITFTELTKRWYVWDGKIHVPCDGEGIAVKIAKKYYDAMTDALTFIQTAIVYKAQELENSGIPDAAKVAKEYLDLYEKGEFTKHRQFRDRMSTDAGLSALIRLMRTECDVPGDYYDNDQDWFVFSNGVLDLKALRESSVYQDESKVVFKFEQHHPSRPVTKFFDAEFNPSSNYGDWDNFLARSIPVKETRDYLQVIVGGAMMGQSKMRVIPNLKGPPHSGKSVFVNTLFKLGKGGAGYSCMPESKAITKVSGQNFDQDSFRGRRFIGISEPSNTEKIDDDFLKRFTGDIWVETRTLNVKSTGHVPQGVVFVASNGDLKINTREKAIVERVQVIEFPVKFELPLPGIEVPEERRADPHLEEKLLIDSSRILTWIFIGMRRFVAADMKLNPPQSVLSKRDELVTDASTALRWVEEYIEDGLLEINFDSYPQYCITINEAYLRYVNWAAQAGERRPLTRKLFTQDIENWYNHEKVKVRYGGQNRFFGIALTGKYQQLWGAGDRAAVDGG